MIAECAKCHKIVEIGFNGIALMIDGNPSAFTIECSACADIVMVGHDFYNRSELDNGAMMVDVMTDEMLFLPPHLIIPMALGAMWVNPISMN